MKQRRSHGHVLFDARIRVVASCYQCVCRQVHVGHTRVVGKVLLRVAQVVVGVVLPLEFGGAS